MIGVRQDIGPIGPMNLTHSLPPVILSQDCYHEFPPMRQWCDMIIYVYIYIEIEII
jgi:hypothetical protein